MRGIYYQYENGKMIIEENSPIPLEPAEKLIIVNKEKVLKTLIQWLADEEIKIPGKPSISKFVRIIHSLFKVLKPHNPEQSYSESRLRTIIDDYTEDMELKKKEKAPKKP